MTLESILRMEQMELKNNLYSTLCQIGYRKIYKPNGFLYAVGTIPILLVAHLDTVHKNPPDIICYSRDGNIIMSPDGIGGDDRAGVYMILEIVKEHKCHVLFCEDEETGGKGARKFAESRHKPNINFIMEFDRRGSNDAVFYNCYNEDFINYICGYGFKESIGSFSDISIIAPTLAIAAVNISAGYYNEHNKHEFICLIDIKNNIERAKKIVSTDTPKFVYKESLPIELFSPYYYGDFIYSLREVRKQKHTGNSMKAGKLRKGV